MASELEILSQRLEFMEQELKDAKSREEHLRNMYDMMLSSLSTDTEQSSLQAKEELESLKVQHNIELKHNQDKYQNIHASLQQKIDNLQQRNCDLEKELKKQRIDCDEKILQYKEEVYEVQSEKNRLIKTQKIEFEDELSSIQQKVKDLAYKNTQLTSDLEKIKTEYEQELKEARADTDNTLRELRSFYEEDKERLKKSIKDMTKQLKIKTKKLERQKLMQSSVFDLLNYTQDQIKMIKDANFDIENNANFWKNDIEDLTEKMLQWIKDANCDWRKLILDELLKYQAYLQKINDALQVLTHNDKKIKQQLLYKQQENDKLMRTIRSKATESPQSKSNYAQLVQQINQLNDSLIQKDSEISVLKHQIGELKLESQKQSYSKPPTYSPKKGHHRSSSYDDSTIIPLAIAFQNPTIDDMQALKSCQRMVNCCSQMRCEFCNSLFMTAQFHEHVLNCKLEKTPRSTEKESNQSICKKLEKCKGKIRNLNREQEILTADNERLIGLLKAARLKWAMDVEKSAEKELELKNELKFMIGKLMHFKRSGLSSEIERVLIEKSIIRANRLIGRRN